MLKKTLLLSLLLSCVACAGTKQMPLKFAASGDYRKPWFSSDRELTLRGSVYNDGADTFVNVDCKASLELSFAGREEPVVLNSDGCPWIEQMNPKTSTPLGQGSIRIDSKWFGYNIQRARLKLHVRAENPFKEIFEYDTAWEEVPQPIYSEAFVLQLKPD